MSKRVPSRIGVFTAALVGALVASHVFSRQANADANCSPPEWQVKLLSVKASNNSQAHSAYWPTDAVLLSSPGHVRIWTTQAVLGVVGTVEVDQ
jgi:hypothetical protein